MGRPRGYNEINKLLQSGASLPPEIEKEVDKTRIEVPDGGVGELKGRVIVLETKITDLENNIKSEKSNFKWLVGLFVPIAIATFAPLYYTFFFERLKFGEDVKHNKTTIDKLGVQLKTDENKIEQNMRNGEGVKFNKTAIDELSAQLKTDESKIEQNMRNGEGVKFNKTAIDKLGVQLKTDENKIEQNMRNGEGVKFNKTAIDELGVQLKTDENKIEQNSLYIHDMKLKESVKSR